MEPTTIRSDLFEGLRKHIAGQVSTPADPEFAAAAAGFNVAVTLEPAAVARPESVADVVEIVRFAREHGFRVAPQRTGHNAEPLAEAIGTAILLRTDLLKGFEIDADGRTARVSAGEKWADVADAASAAGLSPLSGSSRDVGVVGYSLGGGMGFMARKHGLNANSITAVELVTADGVQRRIERETDPELFWALRGGGGNFGVVTAIEFDLYEEPEIYAGTLFFPFERASEVLHAWHRWTQTGLPEDVTSVGRIMQFPDIEEVPEFVRGQSFAIIEAVYTGSEAEGAALVAPLRELGPVMDTFSMVEPAALGYLHMDPDSPLPYFGEHLLLGELPSEAIDRLVANAGPGSGSPLASVELRHMGGALARPADGAGAVATMPGEYLFFAVGGLMTPEMGPLVEAQAALLVEALKPWQSGRYWNFTERPTAVEEFFSPETTSRLAAVRERVDPDGLFLANHQVG